MIVIGALLLVAAAYPYVIYPASLMILRRRASKLNPNHPPSTLFVTVFYNERHIIARKAAELRALGDCLLVDDGSTDNSAALADASLLLPRMGKTSALRQALETDQAKNADVLILSDANVSLSSELVARMLDEFQDANVGAVAAPVLPDTGGLEKIYWHYENRLRRREAEIISAIGCSGACWAVRRQLLENVDFAEMLCEDLWIPLKIRSAGYRIAFADGPPAIEIGSGSETTEYRRRSRIMTGNLQILHRLDEIWKTLPRLDRFFLFSHKIMRWFAPLFLIAGVSTLAIEAVTRGHATAVLIASVIAIALPVTRYFILMNLALLSGYFRRPSSGAWVPERH